MNQTEFLTELANRLIDVPLEERRAALDFYNDFFGDAKDAGRTEEEIIASLESPGQIASRIRAEFAFAQVKSNPSNPKNTGRVIGAVFGILTLPITIPAAAVVFAVGITICAVAFALFITAAAVVLSFAAAAVIIGIQAIIQLFAGAGVGAMIPVLIGLSLISIGITILFIALFSLLLKLFARTVSWIGRSLYKLFARKKKPEVI